MIEINNLTKNYGKKCAVFDVSFTIEKGQCVGFLGPNGAGKSTVMNILTGYLSSTSGEVKVAGIDVLENPSEVKRLVGFLPEMPPLYLDMTVDEYLLFVYELKKCTLPREEHLTAIRKQTKIDDVRGRLLKNLSKGYRQRVGIAQALVGDPPVIILDEPTVGLDPKQIIEIRNLIRTLSKDHTVVLSTHILSEAQALCDRILIINEGRIIADEESNKLADLIEDKKRYCVKICGPERDVLRDIKAMNGVARAEATGERELDAHTYLIEAQRGIDIRKPLFFAMAERGRAILGLEEVGYSLEESFMKIVDRADRRK